MVADEIAVPVSAVLPTGKRNVVFVDKGEGKLGPLTVVFDETALWVSVKSRDGQIWRYQDGVTGRIGASSGADDLGPVEQFVKLRAGKVEVGFKWLDDGSTGHLAYFDAAAFKNPSRPCLWKSRWRQTRCWSSK